MNQDKGRQQNPADGPPAIMDEASAHSTSVL